MKVRKVKKQLKKLIDKKATPIGTIPVTMNELGSFIAIVGVHEDSFYLR